MVLHYPIGERCQYRLATVVSTKELTYPKNDSCDSLLVKKEGTEYFISKHCAEHIYLRGILHVLHCSYPTSFPCQVLYSQFGLAIHQNDHQARRRFVEWAQNEIAVVPDFHKRILFSDEAHFWLNGYVNKQNCRFWRDANPQVYVETPLHPEKLTAWCALWAGGIFLQKR
ncbi:putative DD41D transposase [Trichonephila clavipes]|nr:putative DD41D transposase [Trichonephila clavipes]